MTVVDARRLGRGFRALRHRLAWRQADVGAKADVSQDIVSRAERGDILRMKVESLDQIAGALGADLIILLRWRGGDLDRLLDEGHAALVGAVAEVLDRAGWQVAAEVSFAVFREGGSIDLVAWHSQSRTLLIVEVKTELLSVEETLRRHDAKVRLGGGIVGERFGWQPRAVARLLVLPDASTPRRRVARHDAVLGRAYPLRGPAVRSWLAHPEGAPGSLLFLPLSPTTGVRGRRVPVNRRRIRRSPGASS